MEILRARNGNPQGVIPEIAAKQERLYDRTRNAIATYRRRIDHWYDNNGTRFSSGNRLAGIIDDGGIGLGSHSSAVFFPSRVRLTDQS